jgi:hypothetical protein
MGEAREPLGYETPRERRAVVIERFADGGATVTIHRDAVEAIWPAVLLWGGLALVCIVVWMRVASSVSGVQTALIVLGLPFLIWCVARIAVAAARWNQPIVVGVSPRGMYVDDPRRLLGRRRKCRREDVVICQPVTYDVLNRNGRRIGQRHFVEIQFKSGARVKLLHGEKREPVIEVAGALREALGLDRQVRGN